MKRKRKNTGRSWIIWTIPIVVTFFLVSLFMVLWSIVMQLKWIILIITSILILFYILMGEFKWKKFKKGLKKKF